MSDLSLARFFWSLFPYLLCSKFPSTNFVDDEAHEVLTCVTSIRAADMATQLSPRPRRSLLFSSARDAVTGLRPVRTDPALSSRLGLGQGLAAQQNRRRPSGRAEASKRRRGDVPAPSDPLRRRVSLLLLESHSCLRQSSTGGLVSGGLC